MKRILLFSLLSTLLLTSCMAVQVVGSVAGGAVMVSGYALGANAVTKKVKKKKDKKKKVQKEEVLASQLTEEQQRKYDYFFLEAMRMKEKKEYDAAFGLLEHCLDIHPNASSALYEISQYYMFLRQVPQGQAALEKAVTYAPDNYWYSQGLVSLYQQQNELDKAVTLLEEMVTRFPTKQDPLFNLLDIYGRQEKYSDVISTLNRLEKRLGKNEQLSMEKFRIYLQMKDDKKAFQEIESLVNEYPADMRYQEEFGRPIANHGITLVPGDCVYVDLNADGEINSNDATRDIGYTDMPEYTAGLNTGFSWKNFDFSMQWTGAWNVDRMLDEFRRPLGDTNEKGLLLYQYDTTWRSSADTFTAKFPRTSSLHASNNYAGSDLYLINASYLRLKSVEIGYNFNFPFMKKLKMDNCRLYVNGYNLITITGFKWGDPESRQSSRPNYPLTRVFNIGLKLGF